MNAIEGLPQRPTLSVPPAALKKKLGYAGGFQSINMNTGGAKACVRGSALSENRFSYGGIQTIKQVMIQNNYQEVGVDNAPGMSTLDGGKSLLETLSEQERIDLAKRLVLPPVSKLKHMIDDLYQKEKKYVKQYLREDYIEQNNFIFDLQKSHALHTMKGIEAMPEEAPIGKGQFVGGLYALQAIKHIAPKK